MTTTNANQPQKTDLAFLGQKTDAMPAHLANLSAQDRNLGNENIGAGDQQVPRISLLQALSPQLEEVPGAKAGLFHNSVNNELYEELTVINLCYQREYAVWRKRNKGGGFMGTYETEEAAQAHVQSLPGTATDYDIQETAQHACLLLDPTTGKPKMPVMLYFKSTGMNTSRNWNSQITAFNGDMPRFSSIWTITARKETNDKGTWYNWKISSGAWVPSEALFNEARAFYETMKGHM